MYVLFVTTLLLTLKASQAVLPMPPNVECDTRVDYIATDEDGAFRYSPRVIEMHRCQGFDNHQPHPYNYQCMPDVNGTNAVTVIVADPDQQQVVEVKIANHTKCRMQCMLSKARCGGNMQFHENNCSCTCNYNSANHPTCEGSLEWHGSSCGCQCHVTDHTCPSGKFFNHARCQCECILTTCPLANQTVHTQSCLCVDEPDLAKSVGLQPCNEGLVNENVFVLVVVMEFLGCLFLFFVFYLLCYRPKTRQLEKNSAGVAAYNNEAMASNL